MRIILRGKNLEITPALRAYIETKLLKPIRRLIQSFAVKGLPILDLEIGRSTRHHRKGRVYHVEANLSLDGKLLRAEVDDEDVRAACNLLEEELRREILTYKNRSRSTMLRGARRAKKDLRFSRAARFYQKGRIWNEGN